LSGLPAHSFIFEGFLPVKSQARRKKLAGFAEEKRTVIFYESPHRLLKTLEEMKDVLGDPFVVCGREITKKFEEVRRGSCSELLGHFGKGAARGEFVLLLSQGVKRE
jgi:16S rRNA (cytidine1402-2'-O)-methyltransferase